MDISAWDDTISIGLEKNRWEAVKLELSFSSDESVAKLLLNLYSVWSNPKVALKDVFPTSKPAVPSQNVVASQYEESGWKFDLDVLDNHEANRKLPISPVAFNLSLDTVDETSKTVHESQDVPIAKQPKRHSGKRFGSKSRKKYMQRLVARGQLVREEKKRLKELDSYLHAGALESIVLLENSAPLPTSCDGLTEQYNNAWTDTCAQGRKDELEKNSIDNIALVKQEPILAELSQEEPSLEDSIRTDPPEIKPLPTESALIGLSQSQPFHKHLPKMKRSQTDPVEMAQTPTEIQQAPAEPDEMQELLTDPSPGKDLVDETQEESDDDEDDTYDDPDFSTSKRKDLQTDLGEGGAKRQSRRQSGYEPENNPKMTLTRNDVTGAEVKRPRGRPRINFSDNGPKVTRMPILLQHFIAMKGIEKVVCNECGMHIKPKYLDLSSHLRTDHGLVLRNKQTTVQPLMCSRGSCCDPTFSSLAEYNLHMSLCHNKEISESLNTGPSTEQICDLCGITVKGAKQLAWHITKHHRKNGDGMVICSEPGCGKTFRKKYLRSHINLQHVTVQCQHPGCDRVLSKGRMLTHQRTHILHKLPKLSCPHCSLTVTVAAQMKRHIKEVHMLSKRLECPEFGCNLAFKRMTTLKQHQRIHLNNKSFKCKWCNFSGVQQNNIRSHALTAHPNEFQLAQENEEKYWSGTGAK